MPEFDIISIGGATVDIILSPESETIIKTSDANSVNELLCLSYGGKLKIKEVHESFGGGAANTAVGFSRLGLKSAVVNCLGEDEWGKKILKNYDRNKVDRSLVVRSKAIQSGFSVVLSSSKGERTVLFYAGANHCLEAKTISKKMITSTKWLFLNRISGDDQAIIAKIVNLKKYNKNLKIAWNPGGSQIRDGAAKYAHLLREVELLFLNKEEAAEFANEKPTAGKRATNLVADDDIPKQRDNSCSLPSYAVNCENIFCKLEKYGVNKTIITDGRCGSQLYHQGELWFCPTVNDRKPVDTLGAGDAFASACTYALIQGLSLPTALKFATINATSVVHFYGAQNGLLTKRQMQEDYEKHQIKTIKIKII